MTGDENDKFAIWSVSTDGVQQNLVFEEEIYDLGSPCWSPNGDAIYFKRVGEQNDELWKARISSESGKPIKPPSLVLDGLRSETGYSIAIDGKRLFYAQENQFSNLWLASIPETGKTENVEIKQITTGTFYDSCPYISPDGRLVTFTRGFGKKHNIYVVPTTGGDPQQITFLDSFNFYPSWSPDGTEIAFVSAQGGKARVWKVNVDGGAPHQFQSTKASANSFQLSWSPGQNILSQATGNKTFHILNPRTGEEIPLPVDESVVSVHTAHYSPDGKKIAAYIESTSYPYGIFVFDLEDGSLIDLYEGDYTPVGWSSDSQWVYISVFDSEDVKIFKVSLPSGEAELLFALTPSPLRGLSVSFQVRMSSDERHFVFPASRSQSDIWAIENFDSDIE
jgi:Tol biopolymer transport system component